jgi:hypothetical protein
MTFIFGSWTLGAALLFSAIKNMSLLQLVKGESGPGQPESIVDSTIGVHETTGGVSVSGKGGSVVGKGQNKHFSYPTVARVPGHGELHPAVSAVAAAIMARWPKLTITSTTGGSHATDSYHYKGRAVDLAGPTRAYERKVAAWIKRNLTHVLAEGIHNPGLSVDTKKEVPSSFWGGVWAEHTTHIHIAV